MWALLGYTPGTARNVAPAGVMGETGKSALKVGYKVTRGEDNTQVTWPWRCSLLCTSPSINGY